MAVTDITVPTVNELEADTRQIRQIFLRIVTQNERALGRIRSLVTKHGRAAIAAELGGDAAALGTLYASVKTLLETVEVGKTIEDIPA